MRIYLFIREVFSIHSKNYLLLISNTHSNSIDQDLIEAINNSDIEKFFMWDIRKDLYVR